MIEPCVLDSPSLIGVTDVDVAVEVPLDDIAVTVTVSVPEFAVPDTLTVIVCACAVTVVASVERIVCVTVVCVGCASEDDVVDLRVVIVAVGVWTRMGVRVRVGVGRSLLSTSRATLTLIGGGACLRLRDERVLIVTGITDIWRVERGMFHWDTRDFRKG